MSGDWIWVRDGDGKMRRQIDAPELCGSGHPTVVVQYGQCPRCYAQPVVIFWCHSAGCRWAVPCGRHAERDCNPGGSRKPQSFFTG
jgi:hypothetical protein